MERMYEGYEHRRHGTGDDARDDVEELSEVPSDPGPTLLVASSAASYRSTRTAAVPNKENSNWKRDGVNGLTTSYVQGIRNNHKVMLSMLCRIDPQAPYLG